MKILNPSYIGKRNDILNLVPFGSKNILDVGCSNGVLGENIKINFEAEVVGIEIDKNMVEMAKRKLDRVILCNIEKADLRKCLEVEYFDVIIFGDILEHLINPWKLIENMKVFLKKDGVIIASIPNIRHYSTILNLLLKGSWPYNERGIHDKNHLRFFTLDSIKRMFKNAGFEIIKIEHNYRIIEKPHKLNRLSFLISFPPFTNLITFQYLIVAKKLTSSTNKQHKAVS
ncbi:class I SAM-dependent methyltransferase [Candidatus Parcubacteria bacterium]|nr:class I SAM-dependent methyltransferase [Candidatus Parcubacteria bacterium]